MADMTEAQLADAEARGAEVIARAPRAVTAKYDPHAKRVAVDLANGCTFLFPAALVQDLQHAEDEQLATIVVDGAGLNLHWPALNADLYVPALLAGVFGTRAWMASELARVAGRTTSPAKAAAARVNGSKGGRPRKAG
jgi:hypothetical protein